MDVLSDVLRVIKLDSAVFFNAEFTDPWCFRSPNSEEMARDLPMEGGHVIVYHLLSEGRAYARLEDGEPVALAPGDIVTFPHGDAHFFASAPRATPAGPEASLGTLMAQGLETVRGGGGGATSQFICGFLACDPQLGRAFLGGLPRLLRVNIRDDSSGQWLENSLRFSVAEASAARPGARAMLAKLSEAVFGETLRRYIRDLPADEAGWLAGVRDPDVGRALALLHQQYSRPWTVADLAQEVGLSRTVLADRFRHFLGEPPMAYLTRWRLRVGARALTTTSHGVAQVAFDVGYESEAAFNRAFKREYGVPPARYRRSIRASDAGRQSA